MKNQSFVPHLPNRPVSTVVISSEFPDIKESLERRKVQVLTVEPSQSLATPVQSHADMQILPLDENQILISPDQMSLKEELECLGIKVLVGKRLNPEYPKDVLYDAVRIHNRYICNSKTISPFSKTFWDSCNLKPVWVKQGYTKCSVCVVDQNSIITADAGITKAAQAAGFDVLTISPGFIELPGYDTGLIGGCTGKLSQNCMAFTGRLNSHPDAQLIRCFLQERKIEIVELSNRPLIDIGGIIPIC